MTNKTLSPVKAQSLINSFNGKLFTAEFIKKNGDYRKMLCRTGVSKGIKGTGSYSHTKDVTRSNITVYDFHKNNYRAIPLDRLIKLSHNGVTYSVEETAK